MNILNNLQRINLSKYYFKYFLSNQITYIADQIKTFLTFIILSSFLFQVPAFSQPFSVNAVAAKAAVQGQLLAFANDDAELAFSFAAPIIQSVFKTPQNFIAMVIKSYPVVYRPVKVSFMKPESVGPDLLLPALMTDTRGKVWIANYTLQQQPDGKWLISGCELIEDKSQKMNTVFLKYKADSRTKFND